MSCKDTLVTYEIKIRYAAGIERASYVGEIDLKFKTATTDSDISAIKENYILELNNQRVWDKNTIIIMCLALKELLQKNEISLCSRIIQEFVTFSNDPHATWIIGA